DPDDRLLVFAIGEGGLFPGYPTGERKAILDRCLRFASITFEGLSTLPPSWKPYNAGALVSFFATFGKGAERVVADRRSDGVQGHIYIAEISSREDVYQLESNRPEYA